VNDAQKGLAVCVLIFAAGLGTGWMLWRPKTPKPETYAPPMRQQDGSLVLERKPQEDARPAQTVPKGAKVERIVQVVVQPQASPVLSPPSVSGASGEEQKAPDSTPARPPCPPVRVDLTLVRMPDQSRRVVASSPDGQVIGGVDIPVEAATPQRVMKWAAGPSWNPADRTFGAWIERDAGFLRLGADLYQVREPLAAGGRVTWTGFIRAGIRF
jgi:hypothetical protein